jgi:hypothetical protein
MLRVIVHVSLCLSTLAIFLIISVTFSSLPAGLFSATITSRSTLLIENDSQSCRLSDNAAVVVRSICCLLVEREREREREEEGEERR